MRRLIALSQVALFGFSAGVVHGDSAPVNPPEPVEATPAAAAPVPAPAKSAPGSKSKPADAETIEPMVISAASSAPSANTAYVAPGLYVPPVATHLPDLNKPNPTLVTRQVKTAYYVNTVRVLMPAGIKVNVRKDWYARDIVVVYPKNPYTNWRGVTPDAITFNHTGVVMELIPSGTRYVPAELTVIVPNAIRVEVR
jgi:hypothetical protein